MKRNDVVVVSGVRTAIGGFGGALKGFSPTDLGALVLREAVNRAGVEAEAIGHAVFGHVVHTEAIDQYLSRSVLLKAGLSEQTPALTVNRLCGSGLQAIISAAQQIELDVCNVAVAGGTEVMSRGGYLLPALRSGARMGNTEAIDMMVGALTCPANSCHMGMTAEAIAAKWQISREAQDELALQSHQRAEAAIEAGRFREQILPVELKSRKGVTLFEVDEHVRLGASIDDMKKLRPAFQKEGGTVTAGNASGLNDGAAAVVLMERAEAERRGLQPLGRLAGYAWAGVDPLYMGIGPVPATRRLLADAGLGVDDIDVWEVNEAFAAQALAVVKELGLAAEKVNVNGSGISLGHPIGASGAIIAIKALYELNRTGGRYAVATMCIGGGQGIAALFERV
jgi:acetyl-CoA C-acetyltransferase